MAGWAGNLVVVLGVLHVQHLPGQAVLLQHPLPGVVGQQRWQVGERHNVPMDGGGWGGRGQKWASTDEI